MNTKKSAVAVAVVATMLARPKCCLFGQTPGVD